MNQILEVVANEFQLSTPERRKLALEFGITCAERIAHLLTDDAVAATLQVGRRHLNGTASEQELGAAAAEAAALATSHKGAGGLDGSGNAAVSGSFAVARALAGDALGAAGYAAYAKVYSYASYAVTDPDAYADEHAWQVATLRDLAAQD